MQCCFWTVVVFFVSTVLLYLYSFFCHCSIKRLLNASASTAYTDSCDCFTNYITNMNYNIRLTVISINCKNCSIGCPCNLFLRFPPMGVGAGFSSLAFSVARAYRQWSQWPAPELDETYTLEAETINGIEAQNEGTALHYAVTKMLCVCFLGIAKRPSY